MDRISPHTKNLTPVAPTPRAPFVERPFMESLSPHTVVSSVPRAIAPYDMFGMEDPELPEERGESSALTVGQELYKQDRADYLETADQDRYTFTEWVVYHRLTALNGDIASRYGISGKGVGFIDTLGPPPEMIPGVYLRTSLEDVMGAIADVFQTGRSPVPFHSTLYRK